MTDTLEKAIDWMDRALRETRETLAEVDPAIRVAVTRMAGTHLALRAALVGAEVEWDLDKARYRIVWHGLEVSAPHDGLTIFEEWLVHAPLLENALKAAQP